ncbi:MAG: hypothetical protein JST40_03885 [Armatimonadetes bacterium]|nr:hypothetical protein [Armatimonadota bacterium]
MIAAPARFCNEVIHLAMEPWNDLCWGFASRRLTEGDLWSTAADMKSEWWLRTKSVRFEIECVEMYWEGRFEVNGLYLDQPERLISDAPVIPGYAIVTQADAYGEGDWFPLFEE